MIPIIPGLVYMQQTDRWIKSFVIRYNLCPFAKKPILQDKVKYVVYEEFDLEGLSIKLQYEMIRLSNMPSSVVETTILIAPHVLEDFNQYLDFLEHANSLIFVLGLEGVVQIASFHPDYQFEGTRKEDVTNLTNRSPYPLFHLLREESVSDALENYEAPENIPERNKNKMRELREDGFL